MARTGEDGERECERGGTDLTNPACMSCLHVLRQVYMYLLALEERAAFLIFLHDRISEKVPPFVVFVVCSCH